MNINIKLPPLPPFDPDYRIHPDVSRQVEAYAHLYATVYARAAVAADRESQRALREALEKIAAIENKMVGSDWEEIDEARSIARAALEQKP